MSQSTQRAHQVGDAARDLAGTARDQARALGGQAGDEARSSVTGLRGRVTEEADSQTHRTAGTVRQWADDLAGLADHAPAESPARNLVAQAADGGHRAADYLDQRGVGGLMEDMQTFARRRPAAFLGGAALAGFAIGRIAKAGHDGSGASGGEPGRNSPDEAWSAAADEQYSRSQEV